MPHQPNYKYVEQAKAEGHDTVVCLYDAHYGRYADNAQAAAPVAAPLIASPKPFKG
jgi:hypothetical protein